MIRPGVAGDPAVNVGTLGSVSLEATGVLDDTNGGLGDDLWRGSRYDQITTLVGELPVGTSSRAMRDVMRRLLLTRAAISEDASPEKPSLVAARVQALADMGDLTSVDALLEAVPKGVGGGALARAEADARFLANDIARACEIAVREIEREPSVYWQKAMTFCQILAGETGKAELGLSLLAEEGKGDAGFFAMSDVLLGAGDEIATLANLTPLNLAMVRAAKITLPADVVQSDQPGVLRSLAVNPDLDIDTRLDVAERAESSGALETIALRQLYTSVSFSPDDLGRPLTVAGEILGPSARALLYQAAAGQNVPAAKAEIIARALEIARSEGRYGATARVFQDQAATLFPAAELLWFAPEAVRVFLADGDMKGARTWFSLLQSDAFFRQESKILAQSLTPLVALKSGFGIDQNSNDLSTWTKQTLAPDEGANRGALLFGLMAALGTPPDASVWHQLPVIPEPVEGIRSASILPEATVWLRMKSLMQRATLAAPKRAKTADRVAVTGAFARSSVFKRPNIQLFRGEILLLALIALGEAGPAKAAPQVIVDIVDVFRKAGLEEEARSLALEAALAAGL